MIAAILIGRKGSKGFPGKNLYKVAGKPLAYYPMNAACGCRLIDKRYVSTDDIKLERLGLANSFEIIKRPPQLCSDKALGEDVFIHAYQFIKSRNKTGIELLVLLMCNAPIINSLLITRGIKALRKNPQYDSAITVSRYNMWSPLRARRIGSDGLLHPFVRPEAFGDPRKLNCDRDSQGDVWFADMGVSIIRPSCLDNISKGTLPQRWMGRKIYPLKQEGGLDIDYQWQMPQAKYWIRAKYGTGKR